MKPSWSLPMPIKKALILLLTAGVLALPANCGRRDGPDPAVSRETLAFLNHYGSFSPAEASKIERQIERGPHDLAIQLAAARREGILLKLGDLQPPLPPPDRNAAPIYIQLRRLLKARPLDPATDKIMGSLGDRVMHTPQEIATVRQMLSDRKNVLRLVHQAASRSQCVFHRDWARGMLIEYPENVTMREAARLLSAESYFLTAEGRYREAVANQTQAFRIAQHPTAVPVTICQLVGIACDAIALAGMENILCAAGPNPEIAVEVQRSVANHHPRFNLRRTLAGESALYSMAMNGLRRDAPLDDQAHRLLRELYGSGSKAVPPDLLQEYPPQGERMMNRLLDAAQASYLSLARALIVASQQPYVSCKPLLKRSSQLADSGSHNPVEQLAASGPVLGQLLTMGVQDSAQEDVIIAGAGLLAYKGRHGRFPNQAKDAAPLLPADPFGTGPLKYRREGGGFVVYSVGADGNFDGGRPGAPRDRHQSYFRYPASPSPPKPG